MAKLIAALVLCDVVSHGLKAGHLLEADAALIKALAADGSVDPHKDAVAHARNEGAPLARSSIELAAEKRAADREALLVAIATGEQALKDAKDEETKAALESDIAAKREQLGAIDG